MSRGTLRGAVIGLGMIGRHHARLLQSLDRVAFAGAVDPACDRFRAVVDPDLVFADLDALLAAGPLDLAVVAVPTEEHLACVTRLAEARTSVLVEKPVAATVSEAHELVEACRRHGVRGAVGHVERYNPAVRDLRTHVARGDVGEVFSITATRTGPFPDRIRDVGVVKDLASHDFDTVAFLGGARVREISAQVQHRAGRAHEDLLLAVGSLDNGVSFNLQVDWLTPSKTRQTRVLGEDGMLVADTLSADLTLYRNGEVRTDWGQRQQFAGVTEGDVTRFALQRREPLLVELEAFCDYVAGDDGAPVVHLEEGLAVLRTAEAALLSAAERRTIELERTPA